MISTETFDLIQARRAAVAEENYEPRHFDWSDERFLIDGSDSSRTLRKLELIPMQLLYPGTEQVKLPPEEAWYSAFYTSQEPIARLHDENERTLSIFPLRQRPVGMGDFAVERLVVTDNIEADASLIDEVPLTVSWRRPMGVIAAESPLLYDADKRYAWQNIVMQVLDDLEAGMRPVAS